MTVNLFQISRRIPLITAAAVYLKFTVMGLIKFIVPDLYMAPLRASLFKAITYKNLHYETLHFGFWKWHKMRFGLCVSRQQVSDLSVIRGHLITLLAAVHALHFPHAKESAAVYISNTMCRCGSEQQRAVATKEGKSHHSRSHQSQARF